MKEVGWGVRLAERLDSLGRSQCLPPREDRYPASGHRSVAPTSVGSVAYSSRHMRTILQTIIVVILFVPAVIPAAQKPVLPFEDYRVSETFEGKPAPVKLSSSRARMFRTMLRMNAEKGVNFAGHYIVATWGCGSDCQSLAIIDARTGNVYFTPSVLLVGGQLYQEEDLLQFRKDSRLLIVAGARNDEGSGRYFYVWRNNQLKLIRAVEIDWKQESSN